MLNGIALAGVVLGIDPVEGVRDDSQDIGPERCGLPGGVDLTGGHIFYIVWKGDRDIFGV